MNDMDLFGEQVRDVKPGVLSEKFEYPPFSVLSARDGWWSERKRKWLAMGIKSELGRDSALVGGWNALGWALGHD